MDSTTTTVAVDPRHVAYANIVYDLHALSILIGILSAKLVATAFIFGVPSIIGVVMNYVRRPEIRGTWLESHFRWQIRTFWIALAAFIGVSLVFWPLTLILIGIPFLRLGYFLIGVWAVYRIARGWLALREGRIMPAGGI
jgi:uncharacterized membrane protein